MDAKICLDEIVYRSYKLMIYLAMTNEAELIKILADHEHNVNIKYCELTPLMMAVNFSSYDAVNTLLENGADVNIHDNRGFTALNFAFGKKKRDRKIIQLLVDSKPDFELKTNKGLNIFEFIVNTGSNYGLDILTEALKKP